MEGSSEEEVPAGKQIFGDDGEGSGAGMSFGLPRPEQIILVPQLLRAMPWGEDHVPLPQGGQFRRLLGLLLLGLVVLGLVALRLVALRSHGGGGEGRGEELDGAADAEDGGGGVEAKSSGGFLEDEDAMKTKEETAPASSAFKGEVGDVPHFPIKETGHDLSHDAAIDACR